MGFPGSVLLSQEMVYEQTSDKRHPLGTRGYTRDGRVFRYAQSGSTSILIGNLCQSPVIDTDLDMDAIMADSTDWAAPTTSATKMYLSTDHSNTTANNYADGYLFVTDGTGEGQMIQVKSSEPTTAAAGPQTAPRFDFFGDGRLQTALDTTSEVGFAMNIYNKVVRGVDAAPTAIPIGVTPVTTTASYYFWLQTWGPCPCITVGTIVVGEVVTYGSDTAGATARYDKGGGVTPIASGDTGPDTTSAVRVGECMSVGTDGEYSLIYLKLAP